jgi:hypothetical protein
MLLQLNSVRDDDICDHRLLTAKRLSESRRQPRKQLMLHGE